MDRRGVRPEGSRGLINGHGRRPRIEVGGPSIAADTRDDLSHGAVVHARPRRGGRDTALASCHAAPMTGYSPPARRRPGPLHEMTTIWAGRGARWRREDGPVKRLLETGATGALRGAVTLGQSFGCGGRDTLLQRGCARERQDDDGPGATPRIALFVRGTRCGEGREGPEISGATTARDERRR